MQIKREAVSHLEVELTHGDPDYSSLDVIEVADLKAASPEVFIPANPVEKFVDRYHGFVKGDGLE